MGASRQHVRREVRIGVRLPANHDEIAGEVAQQNVVLDLLHVFLVAAVGIKFCWNASGQVAFRVF